MPGHRQQQQQPSFSTTSMKRRRTTRQCRKKDICWTTALLVCVATLQSSRTIEFGESYVTVAPPLTTGSTAMQKHKNNHKQNAMYRSLGRNPSITTSLAAAKHKSAPTTLKVKKTSLSKKTGWVPKSQQRADMSYQLMDHELLTREQEYELGCKIRKFIDTKKEIDEIVNRKRREQEQRRLQNEQRRVREAEKRRKERERASCTGTDANQYEESSSIYNYDGGDLSMEEELEDFLITKGLNSKNGIRSNSISGLGNSIEDLYGSFDDEDDEEAMMEELGMGIYGIDSVNDHESFSDDLAIVESYDSGYDVETSDDDEVFSALPKTSDSSQLGDTLDAIRLLTEREIKEELGVEGGRKELAKILISGALAKQQMIRSNVRLVTSIARKWMGTSKGSGNAESNSDNDKKVSKSAALGDWSTPAMDEVIQQGIVGLAIAVERFEPERKFKFSTYATYYITNEVRNIFQSATTQCLYVPPYFYTVKNKYEKIVREHYQKTAGDPKLSLSMEKIASILELKPSRLHFILKSTRSLVQLDAPISGSSTSAGKSGGNDSEWNDPIMNSLPSDDLTPEAVVEQSLLRQCLENALAAELLPLERDIVRLRHGLDDGKSRTVKEVMESCGGMLSIGDIRTVESRAYKKLRFRHSVHNARLREFAEEYIGVSPEMLETV